MSDQIPSSGAEGGTSVEVFLRRSLDAMPQIVWMARADGDLDYYNARWYEFMSAGKGKQLGWTAVVHPDDLAGSLERWQRSVATGQPYESKHRFLDQRSGGYRWFLARASAERDQQGEIVRWYGTWTDIDDLVCAEERTRRAREEAEHTNRAKDNFLAALSHELRTPLTPVLMAAAALEQEPAIQPQFREQLGMMRRNIELEARLIDDLLDLTRVSRGKLKLTIAGPIDVHALLVHTEQIVRSTARAKSVTLHFALKACEHHVAGDAARLHQVFWNLLKNAIKFTPNAGRVTVRTSNPGRGQLVITVDDSGMGIDQQTLPLVFHAFERAEIPQSQPADGLGLGLSLSKAIVELHGGKIRAESPGPGLGAVFTIELATVLPLSIPQASGAQQAKTNRKAYRILLVEDHEPTLAVISKLLRQKGHDVFPAANVKSALVLAAGHSFDVVVSDIGLPDGDGIEMMLRLTNEYGLRGIALSGYGMAEDLAKTQNAGFLAHLIKPVNFEHLDNVLQQVATAA